MIQRTTETMVRSICPTEMEDLSIPMRAGAALAFRAFGDLDDELSQLVETNLVAHFVAITDPRAREFASENGVRMRFELGKEGEGLRATPFGRQAMLLDTSGVLATIGAGEATIQAF